MQPKDLKQLQTRLLLREQVLARSAPSSLGDNVRTARCDTGGCLISASGCIEVFCSYHCYNTQNVLFSKGCCKESNIRAEMCNIALHAPQLLLQQMKLSCFSWEGGSAPERGGTAAQSCCELAFRSVVSALPMQSPCFKGIQLKN